MWSLCQGDKGALLVTALLGSLISQHVILAQSTCALEPDNLLCGRIFAVAASSTSIGSPSGSAIDGNLTTAWRADNGEDFHWFIFDLGADMFVEQLQIIVRAPHLELGLCMFNVSAFQGTFLDIASLVDNVENASNWNLLYEYAPVAYEPLVSDRRRNLDVDSFEKSYTYEPQNATHGSAVYSRAYKIEIYQGCKLGLDLNAKSAENLSGRRFTAIVNEIRVQGSTTRIPTSAPTRTPSSAPSDSPTSRPSSAPTDSPSHTPTASPTLTPTSAPTISPTNVPTELPSDFPTDVPTAIPTSYPTNAPTISPTNVPTELPSDFPTVVPTGIPTSNPTSAPTNSPSISPSESPTDTPTSMPTDVPTTQPSDAPSNSPSDAPSYSPSDTPTFAPTDAPSDSPSFAPSAQPSIAPSDSPTDEPTQTPTNTPTSVPTMAPTTCDLYPQNIACGNVNVTTSSTLAPYVSTMAVDGITNQKENRWTGNATDGNNWFVIQFDRDYAINYVRILGAGETGASGLCTVKIGGWKESIETISNTAYENAHEDVAKYPVTEDNWQFVMQYGVDNPNPNLVPVGVELGDPQLVLFHQNYTLTTTELYYSNIWVIFIDQRLPTCSEKASIAEIFM